VKRKRKEKREKKNTNIPSVEGARRTSIGKKKKTQSRLKYSYP